MTGTAHSPRQAGEWRPRGRAVLAVAAVTAALLALDPAPRTDFPVDAEATHSLLGESLLNDGDALFRPEDLRRAYRSWPGGPRGLRLAAVDAEREYGFAVSPVYALLTLPFRSVLGRSGPPVANALALAAAALLLWRRLGRHGRSTPAWWLGAAGASTVPVYAVLPQPQAMLIAAVAAAAALWLDHRGDASGERRAPWAVVGLLLGLGAAMQPSLAVVAVAVVADLAALRRGRELGTALLAAALAWLAAMAVWGALTGGGWGPGSVRVHDRDYWSPSSPPARRPIPPPAGRRRRCACSRPS